MPELTAPETPKALDELAKDPTSRKRFLRMVGGGGGAVALSALLAACGDDDKKNETSGGGSAGGETTAEKPKSGGGMEGDIKIVNYALTLEYLEADFYAQVIDSGLVKDKKVVAIAQKFGETEQEHVDALKATVEKLGGTAVKQPKTNFGPTLEGGLEKVLQTAATVENLGAAAYLGQAGNIENKEILAAALAIHSVEARHAAALNKLIGAGFRGDGPLNGSIPDGAFAKPMSEQEVLEAVKPFLA